jgi:hypothetical protein
VGRNVVVAEAQHFGRFRRGASVMTIPADEPIESMQLDNVNWAVFRKSDVR